MGGVRNELLLALHGFLHRPCGEGGEPDADGEKQQHGAKPDGQQHQREIPHGTGDVVRGGDGDAAGLTPAAIIDDTLLAQGAKVNHFYFELLCVILQIKNLA